MTSNPKKRKAVEMDELVSPIPQIHTITSCWNLRSPYFLCLMWLMMTRQIQTMNFPVLEGSLEKSWEGMDVSNACKAAANQTLLVYGKQLMDLSAVFPRCGAVICTKTTTTEDSLLEVSYSCLWTMMECDTHNHWLTRWVLVVVRSQLRTSVKALDLLP